MTILQPGTTLPVENLRAFEDKLLCDLPVWEPGGGVVRLIVPSKSLQRHWIRKITQARGAAIGVEVVTYRGLISDVLGRGKIDWHNKTSWFEHRARVLASDDPVLRSGLGDLDDGLGLVARMVSELVDAGFEPAHSDAILENIRDWPRNSALGVGSGVAPRVGAVVRVAQRLCQELDGEPPCTLPMAIDSAIELMLEHGEEAYPSRHIVFLGFADATGKVADLIEACQRHLGAVVAVEVPPSPSRPSERDPGHEFAAAFHARFSGRWAQPIGPGGSPETLRWICADDPYAEAQAVADEARRAISDGIAPEDIGVVVRATPGWVTPLRRAFSGAGVPYSGVGAEGIGDRESRRLLAIAACIDEGPDAPVGLWASACGYEHDARGRLAFDSLGIRVVQDIPARLQADVSVKLDVREGIVEVEGEVRIPRATFFASEASAVHGRAAAYLDCLREWPDLIDSSAHQACLRALLVDGMGIDSGDPIWIALDVLQGEFKDSVPIERSEFFRMVVEAIRPLGLHRIGGLGGGVAILDATEARGRTFSRLFVLGLNRGHFPRLVREDPLVPDAARRALRQFLPDLRAKRLGVHEERFLFAQLLASSPHVTLSSARADVRGVAQHLSSFLVELQLHKIVGEPVEVSILERPAWEVSSQRGLSGLGVEAAFQDQIDHRQLLNLTLLRRGRKGISGPYFGDIGPVIHPVDPRQRDMYVTTVEAIAQCPWRALMEKHLGIRERADPHGALPEVSGHLLGRVVHRVVERVVLATTGSERLGGHDEALPLAWPSQGTLEGWIVAAASECLRSDGVAWEGFAKAVVVPALAALLTLRELDADLQGVWGAEQKFVVELDGGRTVAFQADRLDLEAGRPILTDIKLGKPPTVHKKPETRRAKVLEGVRRGRLLQGALYARAMPTSAGRYFYIKADLDVPERAFVFSGEDEDVGEALEAIVEEVTAAVSAGTFFPRVSEASEDKVPIACSFCAVRETCIVEDSSLRMALMARMEADDPLSSRKRLWTRGEGGAE